ncbi:MAG: IMPACT family protein [Candidatus Syntrophosphaera sp.]
MAYQSVASPSSFQQKIKRSSFDCFLFPISSAQEAQEIISAHNRDHANATHNCFAYICGYERETQYYSDAGEPHGTAGKPILNALLRGGMTNVLAIVTRHYGGIKLGVKGLIEAYGGTCELALARAEKIVSSKKSRFRVALDYALADHLLNLVNSLRGDILETQWGKMVNLTLSVPEKEAGALREFLDGYKGQSRLDYSEEEV